MKVLITGANGQLGRELVRQGRHADYEVHGLNRQQLDITRKDKIEQILARMSPSVVINAAAYTQVDRAENESALAYAAKLAPKLGQDETILICLSGRGDKDAEEVGRFLKEKS